MEINKRLSAIGCNKLEISWQPYDNYYDSNLSSLTGINQFTVIEGELIDFLRNLQRVNFKNVDFHNDTFDTLRCIDKILRISDFDVNSKAIYERTHRDFRFYEFRGDYIDPLEEFRITHSKDARGGLTDHCLYVLTHSPSFANLRVIDLRNNKIKSLMTLKVNMVKFFAPLLEELYIDTTVDTPEESYDISFFFCGLIHQVSNLKVLWLEAKKNQLSIEESEIASLAVKKLTLKNLVFKGATGQKFLDRLTECQELSLTGCTFMNLRETNSLDKLKGLEILSLDT